MFCYKPGKMGWLASALPSEGEEKSAMIFDQIDHRVPTCQLKDLVREAKRQANDVGFDICAVVNEENVVLGIVDHDQWRTDRPTTVAEIMKAGPKTIRPSASLKEANAILDKDDLESILVTTSDGKLLGIFTRSKKRRANERIPKAEVRT